MSATDIAKSVDVDLDLVQEQAASVAEELIAAAKMKEGQILVVGCSSSEILGGQIGKYSSMDAAGERDFSFYRSANADVMLSKEDIPEEALKATKIVHFGSVSLTADPSRTATLDAAVRAKKLGAVITYDPNYRANLWKNKEDAIAQMKAPLPLVDILKVSDEELPLLTGTTDCAEGTAQLAQNGIRLIFVTLGANGVFYRFGEKTGHVAGVPCKVGDTNGAGDTFFGAALSKLCKEDLNSLTADKLESILAFANKAASITTSRRGAIPAMPTLTEVEG